MILFIVEYDDFYGDISIFDSLDKAKQDIIKYIKNFSGLSGWNLEEIIKAFQETAEIYGFSNWEEGFMKCEYKDIPNYLGNFFASIKAIQLNKSIWDY